MSREPDAMGIAWRAAIVASCSRPLTKNPSWLTNRASAGSRQRFAKAALISRLVLGLRTSVLRTMAGAGRRPVWQGGLGAGGIGGIDQHRHPYCARHQLAQQLEPLGRQFEVDEIDSGHVGARAGDAGH